MAMVMDKWNAQMIRLNKTYEFLREQMPNGQQCIYEGCTYPWSHASESHHCFHCGQRGTHSSQDCPIGRNGRRERSARSIHEVPYENELSG